MGPHPCRRGKPDANLFWVIRDTSLQWGHALADVDTSEDEILTITCDLLQWGHDSSDADTPGYLDMFTEAQMLQWGHVLSDVDTADAARCVVYCSHLQWGHVRPDVDTTPTGTTGCRSGCFNGATSTIGVVGSIGRHQYSATRRL